MITSSSSWPARNAGYIALVLGMFLAGPSRATDGTQLTGIGAVQQGTCGTGVASPKRLRRLEKKTDPSEESQEESSNETGADLAEDPAEIE